MYADVCGHSSRQNTRCPAKTVRYDVQYCQCPAPVPARACPTQSAHGTRYPQSLELETIFCAHNNITLITGKQLLLLVRE